MSNEPTGDLLFQIALASGRYTHPLSLTRHNAQVYSQNGEDGVIAEIFNRIGTTNRFFVEIGIENGLQNNTRFLLEQGWHGVWIDGNKEAVQLACHTFKAFLESGSLHILHQMIDMQSAHKLGSVLGLPSVVDFLSVDIDQNTYHIWNAIDVKARVACVEYNGQLPAASAVSVPYDPDQQWTGTNWYGASLKALEFIARRKGMHLVSCDLLGINAFFVDDSLTKGRFMEPFDAETHHEPMRLSFVRAYGHPLSPVPRSWNAVSDQTDVESLGSKQL